jgi:hypothetical protein
MFCRICSFLPKILRSCSLLLPVGGPLLIRPFPSRCEKPPLSSKMLAVQLLQGVKDRTEWEKIQVSTNCSRQTQHIVVHPVFHSSLLSPPLYCFPHAETDHQRRRRQQQLLILLLLLLPLLLPATSANVSSSLKCIFCFFFLLLWLL